MPQNNNRPSYEEWLKSQGVVGKNENTLPRSGMREKAVINYLFDDETSAITFSKNFFLSDTKPFHDRLSGKSAILINLTKHLTLKVHYKKYIKENYDKSSVKEIQDQIDAIDARLKILANKELSKRLNTLNLLALNKSKKGWQSHPATSAFHLSLQNYIALNRDFFNNDELAALQTMSRLLMGDDGSVFTGLKQDANWWEYTLTYYKSVPSLKMPVITDALHLLDGETYRRAIDNTTPVAPMLVEKNDKKSPKRNIPRFFPDKNGSSDVDRILLDSGGMATHRTVTAIWKRSIDHYGNLTQKGQVSHHWDFFQTEYNGGAGLTWAQKPFFNTKTNANTTGIAWTVLTKPIKANWVFNQPLRRDETSDLGGRQLSDDEIPNPINNLSEYNSVMHDTLANLIISQRLITTYKPARPSSVTGDPQNYSEPGSEEAKAWTHWRDRIDSHLGKMDESLSKKGPPQTSGNCTVMSLKVMTDDYLPNFSEEHWLHAKSYDHPTTIQALELKKTELIIELNATKIIIEDHVELLFEAINKSDLEKVENLLSKHPLWINERDKQFNATPLCAAVYNHGKNSGSIEIISFLLNQENVDIDAQDKHGYTALHHAIWYNHENPVINILEKNPNIFIKNVRNESAYELAMKYSDSNKIKDRLKLSEKQAFFTLLQQADQTKITEFLQRNPELIKAISDDKHKATPLITILVHASSQQDPKKSTLLAIAKSFIDQMDIATLNMQDNYGDTALHRATWYGFDEIALQLMDKNVDLKIPNHQYRSLKVDTPYTIIQSLGSETLKEKLAELELKSFINGQAKNSNIFDDTVKDTKLTNQQKLAAVTTQHIAQQKLDSFIEKHRLEDLEYWQDQVTLKWLGGKSFSVNEDGKSKTYKLPHGIANMCETLRKNLPAQEKLKNLHIISIQSDPRQKNRFFKYVRKEPTDNCYASAKNTLSMT